MKGEEATGRGAQLANLCRQNDVAILYAFGSRAQEVRGWVAGIHSALEQSESDLDIGVKALQPNRWTLNDKIDFAYALEDLFSGGSVDLIDLDQADPFLAANVIRGERLYTENEHLADEYDLYVLRRAGDLIPLENERLDMILHRNRQQVDSGSQKA